MFKHGSLLNSLNYNEKLLNLDLENSQRQMLQNKPLDEQVGGDHYKTFRIQPAEYILTNKIPWAEGDIITYVSRWRFKNGLEDLEKARHFLDILIDHVKNNPELYN